MSTKRELQSETRMSQVLDLPHPYLLFLGDTTEAGYAKTAFGLRDWAADRCVGEWSCDGTTVTTGLPRLSPKEARARRPPPRPLGRQLRQPAHPQTTPPQPPPH